LFEINLILYCFVLLFIVFLYIYIYNLLFYL
jgi:hypothetical protein